MTGRSLADHIGGQKNGTGRPGRFFFWPDGVVSKDVTRPVTAINLSELLDPREELDRALKIAHRRKAHHQFAGFCHRYPGLIVHATATEILDNELMPSSLDTRVCLRARDDASENWIKPIH